MKLWILRLTGAALLSAVALAIAPEGQGKRALRLVCGFVLLSAVFSLLIDFDWSEYALDLQRYRQEGESIASEGAQQAAVQTRLVIQQQCETYILDKARSLQIADCSCKVTAEWNSQGYWVPKTCTVSAVCDSTQQLQLCHWIEANLGIPAAGQQWTVQSP